jgi:hypothetical protein
VRVAEERRLDFEVRTGMSGTDLAALVAAGVPAMLAIQAWANDPPADTVGWAARTADGHHMVAVGHDAARSYFEDPGMFGVGYVEVADLDARWHGFDEFGHRL